MMKINKGDILYKNNLVYMDDLSDDFNRKEFISELDLILNVDNHKKNWNEIILIDDVNNMLKSIKEMIDKIDHLNILHKQYQKDLIKRDIFCDGVDIIKKHAVYTSNLSQILVLKCDVLKKRIP